MKDKANHLVFFAKAYGLWRGVAWGLGIVAMIDGSFYLVRGNASTVGPSYTILRNIPGGMHTHGIIILIISASIFYSSAQKGILARRVQYASFVYAVWLMTSTVTGCILAGQFAIGSTTKWALIGWLNLWLALTAGTERRVRMRRENDLPEPEGYSRRDRPLT